MLPNKDNVLELSDIKYVKRISVGGINPNTPPSEKEMEDQIALLNKYLNEPPRGKIIGREINVGVFKFGEHQIILQKITYHVGFQRKPHNID